MDRWAAASPGERAAHAGCVAHHCGHRLLYRVCQQYGHYHHLLACPGGAGERPAGAGLWGEEEHPGQTSLPSDQELHGGLNRRCFLLKRLKVSEPQLIIFSLRHE